VTQGHILIAAALVAAVLAGCASTPGSRFYALNGEEPGQAASGASYSVSVGPVSVPDMVDRPQMVLNASANRIEIDEFHRWAAPLRSEIPRVVAENLSRLLGTPWVWPAPNAPGDTDFRVQIDVQRFEATPAGAVTFAAVWTVRRVSGGAPRGGQSLVHEPAGADGIDGIAAIHSRALGAMSRDIAQAIRALAAEPR
jgi:uncharacterized protein